MKRILHIIGGDHAGASLEKSGVPGEVFVWHDILYDGPREPGWPNEATHAARARFLDEATAGGMGLVTILDTLRAQYRKLAAVGEYDRLCLWFDACLFDQAMLAHILACLKLREVEGTELVCVAAFPGIVPYHGLGQLSPEQLATVYDRRCPVTGDQFAFAGEVDRAFATQDQAAFVALSRRTAAPLPWVPAAVARWLEERPDPATGLGRLEQLALDALRAGCTTPAEIFAHVAAHDVPPRYWGDITLWAKINGLAARTPPLARITGPAPLLPQWDCQGRMEAFGVVAA
ncbi:hypothetical protein FO488_04925 [Geobacter sp. FeAm09]|uniref:hypothetical protein n=1 Tax=Geobacter sp. FeAm09 TaxID=2597769 RepID=UPI0011ECC820|nr:hypothetical protein [Geobacter sp. FeAm09]QEM67556.1 hypothetical protein FO488_04925 [Geobacter sp. FeAm09]